MVSAINHHGAAASGPVPVRGRRGVVAPAPATVTKTCPESSPQFAPTTIVPGVVPTLRVVLATPFSSVTFGPASTVALAPGCEINWNVHESPNAGDPNWLRTVVEIVTDDPAAGVALDVLMLTLPVGGGYTADAVLPIIPTSRRPAASPANLIPMLDHFNSVLLLFALAPLRAR
jgi:hypothetical protein